MLSKEEYLTNLLREIEQRKNKGKTILNRIGAKIDHNTAKYLEDYFKNKKEYHFEIKNNCYGCKDKWDIVILFLKV